MTELSNNRPTRLRSTGGASGVRMDVRRTSTGSIATLQGEMSEGFGGEALGQRLLGDTVMDLSGIDRITSFGVREWLTMMREQTADRMILARCSEAFVDQVLMIRAFCGTGQIASFFAPYACITCGAEFGVLYDAIGDRDAILARSPVPMSCPQCGSETTFDDDPDLYFSLENHLLTELDPRTAAALEQLTHVQHVPIQKVVVGHETWVSFHGRMDSTVRLRRALEGLEGCVMFDLSPAQGGTEEGHQRFLDYIHGLGPEVDKMVLVGVPIELAEVVLAAATSGRSDLRLRIASLKVLATCTDGSDTHRQVLVDLRTPGVQMALRQGLPPPLACDWCPGKLDISPSMPLLLQILALAPGDLAEPVRAWTPDTDLPHHLGGPDASMVAPALGDPYASAISQGDPPFGSQGNGGRTLVPYYATPEPANRVSASRAPDASHPHSGGRQAVDSATATLEGVQRWDSHPHAPWPSSPNGGYGAGSSRRSFGSILFGLVALVFGTVIGSLAFLVVILILVGPIGGSLSERFGDTTTTMPPPWADQPFLQTDTEIILVGRAHASTPEAGLRLARRDMMRTFLHHLQQFVQRDASFELILPDAATLGEAALDEAIVAYQSHADRFTTPERIDDAVFDRQEGVGLVVRYRLSAAQWAAATSFYSETHHFRGLTVANAFPTLAPELEGPTVVVVATRPWLRAAEVGDVVDSVSGITVRSMAAYEHAVDMGWDKTRPGQWMMIQTLRGEEPREVEFRKPR